MNLISKERREEWEKLLCDYFNAQKNWIVGHYQEYIEDGLSDRAAMRQTRRDFFELVVDEMADRADEMADRADDAVTWDRVKRDNVREALEALDGFVFRAMFRGALRGATARLMGQGAGFALLLETASETIQAAQEVLDEVQEAAAEIEDPSEAHTVIQPGPADRPTPRRDALEAHSTIVPDFSIEIVDAEETNSILSSGAEVKGRLEHLLKGDRAVLRPPALDLPDDDDTDEEPVAVPLPSRPSRLMGSLGLGGIRKALTGGGQ